MMVPDIPTAHLSFAVTASIALRVFVVVCPMPVMAMGLLTADVYPDADAVRV